MEPSPVRPVIVSAADLDRDPHGLFRRYRPLTPVITRSDGTYVVIRAADVERLVTDPRTRQMETESLQMRGITDGSLFEFFRHSMLLSNAPHHRKRRAPLNHAVAARLISDLRPRIRGLALELIDRAGQRRELNFLDDFCALIPAHIVAAILGLPPADVPRFTRWVYSVSRAISASFAREEVPDIEAATSELTSYVGELLASRRAAPRADFLSSYVAAVDEAGDLSPVESVAQVVTVIIGGSDTTRAAMAMQVALLLEHREQWDAVCRETSLVSGAVSEALRYDPAVGSFPRVTLEDIDIEGQVVPRGRIVSLSTMSAMRDPARYNDPDRFDIRRTDHPARHPVFGGGTHRCLGEALARAELEEGLAAVAERLPNLELDGAAPVLVGHSGIRRITGMSVRWS
jgi:cytochrome P450